MTTTQHYTLEPFQMKVIQTKLPSAVMRSMDALPLPFNISLIQEGSFTHQIWSRPPQIKNSSHRQTLRIFEMHADLHLTCSVRGIGKHLDSRFPSRFRHLPRFTSFSKQPMDSSTHSIKLPLREELYSLSGMTSCPGKFLRLQSIRSHTQQHPNFLQDAENDEEPLPPYSNNQSEAGFQALQNPDTPIRNC